MRVRAEGSEAVAMVMLGNWYKSGLMGLAKDAEKGFEWFKKAADLDDRQGLAGCALSYLSGHGVEKDVSQGLVWLARAAEMSCEIACCWLGRAYASGLRHAATHAARPFALHMMVNKSRALTRPANPRTESVTHGVLYACRCTRGRKRKSNGESNGALQLSCIAHRCTQRQRSSQYSVSTVECTYTVHATLSLTRHVHDHHVSVSVSV